MTIGLMFWILMLIWLVFSGWVAGWAPRAMGGSLLLGWSSFGPPIHG